MAQSPTEKTEDTELSSYLKNWNALGSMIVRGRSFSGYERNCFFLNTSNNKTIQFADASAVSSLDLIDDGRAIIANDWDHDGDLDIWTTNREAPRIRFLRNNLSEEKRSKSVSFKLKGTSSNRDAIGAVLKLKVGPKLLVNQVVAGDGFLSQTSKRITFGIGNNKTNEKISLEIIWPDGSKEEFIDIKPGSNYEIIQGSKKAEITNNVTRSITITESKIKSERISEKARIVLTHRIKSPKIEYINFEGEALNYTPQKNGNSPILINLWASWCGPCVAELNDLKKNYQKLSEKGLKVLALSTDFITEDNSRPNLDEAKKIVTKNNYPFDVGVTDANSLRLLTVMHNGIFAREKPLPLPTSFLIDKHGQLSVIYRGPVSSEQVFNDINLLSASPRAVAESAWPFKSSDGSENFKINKLDFAKAYQKGGYYDDALLVAQNYLKSITENDSQSGQINRAKTWMFIAALEQGEKNWRKSSDAYLEAIKILPNQSLIKIQAAVVLWMSGKKDQANDFFLETSGLGKKDPKILNTLGKAHQQIDREKDAIEYFKSAIALSPNNIEFKINLAIAYQRNGETAKAIEEYKSIVKNDNNINARNNLSYILSTDPDTTLRDGELALKIAKEINEVTNFNNHSTLDTLAAALAETNQFDQAIKTIKKAITIARSRGNDLTVTKLRQKLEYYKSGKPFRKKAS